MYEEQSPTPLTYVLPFTYPALENTHRCCHITYNMWLLSYVRDLRPFHCDNGFIFNKFKGVSLKFL